MKLAIKSLISLALLIAMGANFHASADEFEDLKVTVNSIDAECPTSLGDGLTMLGFELNEQAKNLYISIKYDDPALTAEILNSISQEIRELFTNSFCSDESFKQIIGTLRRHGYGLMLKFYDSTDTCSNIYFSNSDLAKLPLDEAASSEVTIDKLRNFAASANAGCPDGDDEMVLRRVYLDEAYQYYTMDIYLTDKSELDVDYILDNKERVKQMFLDDFRQDYNIRQLFKDLQKLNYGTRLIFHDSKNCDCDLVIGFWEY